MIREAAAISKRAPSILDELLTSRTRGRLLTIFLTHPGEEYFLRELVRYAGLSLRAVQHELARLERLELVQSRRHGQHKYYRANEHHPLFADLKRIVYKTTGLGDVLREALEPIKGIQVAFIYGSIAKGNERPTSDVDLLLIGTADADNLHEGIRRAEETLGREVSYVTMSPAEWRERRALRDAFMAEVARSPKIFLIGDERTLRRA
jgi:predicted nucleotidyltransferase